MKPVTDLEAFVLVGTGAIPLVELTAAVVDEDVITVETRPGAWDLVQHKTTVQATCR